jgi:hypothetical protein
MIGIEFTYAGGKKDWYDPIDEDEFESNQTDSTYEVDVHYHRYTIQKSDVVHVRKYQLCEECGYEIGTCNCEDEEEK